MMNSLLCVRPIFPAISPMRIGPFCKFIWLIATRAGKRSSSRNNSCSVKLLTKMPGADVGVCYAALHVVIRRNGDSNLHLSSLLSQYLRAR